MSVVPVAVEKDPAGHDEQIESDDRFAPAPDTHGSQAITDV